MESQRMKHVDFWAEKCKGNIKACQREVFAFVDSQLELSNAFYRKLLRTSGGLEKIRALRRIGR